MTTTELHEELRKAREAEREARRQYAAAFTSAFREIPLEASDRDALLVARDRCHQARVAAERAYLDAAGPALRLIARIEAEAEAAKRAVLDRYRADLDAARAIEAQAHRDRERAYDAANRIETEAINEVRNRLHSAYLAAAETRRKNEIALAIALIGGPAVLPSSLRIGARRRIEVPARGHMLFYHLRPGGRGSKPSATATVRLIVPIPGEFGDEINLAALQEGENLRDAIRKAEEQGIKEGWLVRPAAGEE